MESLGFSSNATLHPIPHVASSKLVDTVVPPPPYDPASPSPAAPSCVQSPTPGSHLISVDPPASPGAPTHNLTPPTTSSPLGRLALPSDPPARSSSAPTAAATRARTDLISPSASPPVVGSAPPQPRGRARPAVRDNAFLVGADPTTLTSTERDRAERIRRRMAKNRMSAQHSRERKRVQLDDLRGNLIARRRAVEMLLMAVLDSEVRLAVRGTEQCAPCAQSIAALQRAHTEVVRLREAIYARGLTVPSVAATAVTNPLSAPGVAFLPAPPPPMPSSGGRGRGGRHPSTRLLTGGDDGSSMSSMSDDDDNASLAETHADPVEAWAALPLARAAGGRGRGRGRGRGGGINNVAIAPLDPATVAAAPCTPAPLSSGPRSATTAAAAADLCALAGVAAAAAPRVSGAGWWAPPDDTNASVDVTHVGPLPESPTIPNASPRTATRPLLSDMSAVAPIKAPRWHRAGRESLLATIPSVGISALPPWADPGRSTPYRSCSGGNFASPAPLTSAGIGARTPPSARGVSGLVAASGSPALGAVPFVCSFSPAMPAIPTSASGSPAPTPGPPPPRPPSTSATLSPVSPHPISRLVGPHAFDVAPLPLADAKQGNGAPAVEVFNRTLRGLSNVVAQFVGGRARSRASSPRANGSSGPCMYRSGSGHTPCPLTPTTNTALLPFAVPADCSDKFHCTPHAVPNTVPSPLPAAQMGHAGPSTSPAREAVARAAAAIGLPSAAELRSLSSEHIAGRSPLATPSRALMCARESPCVPVGGSSPQLLSLKRQLFAGDSPACVEGRAAKRRSVEPDGPVPIGHPQSAAAAVASCVPIAPIPICGDVGSDASIHGMSGIGMLGFPALAGAGGPLSSMRASPSAAIGGPVGGSGRAFRCVAGARGDGTMYPPSLPSETASTPQSPDVAGPGMKALSTSTASVGGLDVSGGVVVVAATGAAQ